MPVVSQGKGRTLCRLLTLCLVLCSAKVVWSQQQNYRYQVNQFSGVEARQPFVPGGYFSSTPYKTQFVPVIVPFEGRKSVARTQQSPKRRSYQNPHVSHQIARLSLQDQHDDISSIPVIANPASLLPGKGYEFNYGASENSPRFGSFSGTDPLSAGLPPVSQKVEDISSAISAGIQNTITSFAEQQAVRSDSAIPAHDIDAAVDTVADEFRPTGILSSSGVRAASSVPASGYPLVNSGYPTASQNPSSVQVQTISSGGNNIGVGISFPVSQQTSPADNSLLPAAIQPIQGYPSNIPQAGQPAAIQPSDLPAAIQPIPGYPSNIPQAGQPAAIQPSDLPAAIQPIHGYPSNIPQAGQPAAIQPSDLPAVIQPLPGYPSNIPQAGQPAVVQPSDIPAAIQPLPGYPSNIPQAGQPAAIQPLPGYPSNTSQAGQPAAIQPSDLPAAIQPISGYPSNLPQAVQPAAIQPSDLPAAIQPISGYPSNLPQAGQPAAIQPSDLPAAIQPIPGYPSNSGIQVPQSGGQAISVSGVPAQGYPSVAGESSRIPSSDSQPSGNLNNMPISIYPHINLPLEEDSTPVPQNEQVEVIDVLGNSLPEPEPEPENQPQSQETSDDYDKSVENIDEEDDSGERLSARSKSPQNFIALDFQEGRLVSTEIKERAQARHELFAVRQKRPSSKNAERSEPSIRNEGNSGSDADMEREVTTTSSDTETQTESTMGVTEETMDIATEPSSSVDLEATSPVVQPEGGDIAQPAQEMNLLQILNSDPDVAVAKYEYVQVWNNDIYRKGLPFLRITDVFPETGNVYMPDIQFYTQYVQASPLVQQYTNRLLSAWQGAKNRLLNPTAPTPMITIGAPQPSQPPVVGPSTGEDNQSVLEALNRLLASYQQRLTAPNQHHVSSSHLQPHAPQISPQVGIPFIPFTQPIGFIRQNPHDAQSNAINVGNHIPHIPGYVPPPTNQGRPNTRPRPHGI